jgi:hypothetical protein
MPAIVTAQSGTGRALQRRINANRPRVEKHAWRTDQYQQESARAETDLAQWREQYSRFTTDLEARMVTIYYVLIAGLFGVYCADCLILGSVVEFLSGINFEGQEWLVTTARFAFPAIIIFMELSFASLGLRASETVLDGLGSRAMQWFWNFWAFVLALVMPAGASAVFLVSQPDLPGLVNYALLVMLVALALAGHIMILFGRQHVLDALAFVRFRFGESSMQGRIRRSNARTHAERQLVSRHFTEYAGDLNNYNTLFPNAHLAAEPFDMVTLRVVREIFGSDAIQTANGGQRPSPPVTSAPANGPTQQPEPRHTHSVPPNPDEGSAENEYLRMILQRRQRDEDSEVRP